MDIEKLSGRGRFRDVYWLVEPERTALAFSEPSCGALYRWYLPAPALTPPIQELQLDRFSEVPFGVSEVFTVG